MFKTESAVNALKYAFGTYEYRQYWDLCFTWDKDKIVTRSDMSKNLISIVTM